MHALGLTVALVATSCGGDDDATPSDADAPEPVETVADDADDAGDETGEHDDVTDAEPSEETAADDPVDDTDPVDDATDDADPVEEEIDDVDPADDPFTVFPTLGPPSGEPMLVGLVNTEGTPGLDFPDIRRAISGVVDYLNQHGGYGDRPIDLEVCVAAGSPETSQACAQELTGRGAELVLLGLDLFPDYATYTAAGVPVIGVLPILAGDYGADARFVTGGNATVMAASAGVADEYFGASTVGIISADNPGGNASRDALTGALDLLGIDYVSVTGGDDETDAGFLGLMRQAATGDPDLILSLYDEAGCIGLIRGRADLGIDTPVLSTGICAAGEVIDQVGDDALGWYFMGVATQEDDLETEIVGDIMGPVLGVAPDEVDTTSLGLGGLGMFMTMTLATLANHLAADGTPVTGESLYELLDTGAGFALWPGGAPLECGAADAYPAVCSFTFPVAEYLPGGEVRTVEGFDAFSALDFLP